ncbi:MAG: rhomboid family intramembrane serine protease [Myxococcota bacterium]
MSNWPDHPRALVLNGAGVLHCPFCGGALMPESELAASTAQLNTLLALETNRSSGAFARTRTCPSCASPMAPWRIGKLEAWVEKCPTCANFWLDRQDLRTLEMLTKKHALVAAVQSLAPTERAQMAKDLATATVSEDEPRLTPFHAFLAALGLPVVQRIDSNRAPLITWAMALALLAVFLFGLRHSSPGLAWSKLALDDAAPTLVAAITSVFAHGGWLHLLGNLYFLLAFGDGAEQKLPRPLLVFTLAALGAVANAIQLGLTGGSVGGASGGIAAVMGACFVLQPRARVVIGLWHRLILPMPLWLFGVFEGLFQLTMAGLGVPGIAWWAHLSGLVMGVILGFLVKARQVRAKDFAK